ncbi:MAG: hypothetical protein K0S74_363 [Chlamydiales bacterium]|jgi:hypothetical protein|nr:hypothetical protein [Chlamydiales bacterium]
MMVQKNNTIYLHSDLELGTRIWKLFDRFWQEGSTGAGFEFKDFKTLFLHFEGKISKKNKSSHRSLKYINVTGRVHCGFTYKPHPVAIFGHNAMKMLRSYFTECGLTRDYVQLKTIS